MDKKDPLFGVGFSVIEKKHKKDNFFCIFS